MGGNAAPAIHELKQSAGVFSPEDRQSLIGIARAMYPHAPLPDAPYARAVDAILAEGGRDPLLAAILLEGLAEASDAGVLETGVPIDGMTAYLEAVAPTPFFESVRSRVCWHLYDDPEVREFIGYPGEAFSLGGYLHRGFDDVDWLPTPRIVELSEPMIETGRLHVAMHSDYRRVL